MIDPVNPGPAGSTGPAGGEAGVGPPGDLTPVLTAGTAIIAQAIQAATSAIQEQINSIFGVVNSAIGKAAGSVTQAINTAQSTLDLSAARATGSVAALLSAATPPGSPAGPSLPGSEPVAGNWNVFQFVRSPYPSRFTQDTKIAGVDMTQWCFRGSWPNVDDAGQYSLSIDGKQPPDWCIPPGGPAVGLDQGVGQQLDCPAGYQVWQDLGGGTGSCAVLCFGSPAPGAGWVPYGGSVSLQTAQQTVASSLCAGTIQPVGGGSQYYAGCVQGQAVYWTAGQAIPAGVQDQAGPFADLSAAQAAIAGKCQPPPPPTGGTGTGGMCCDPLTGEIKLPKCIYIDLCDWQKFTDALIEGIYKGLCKWIKDPSCQCPTMDSDRWIAEDCDGQVAAMVDAWKGRVGSVLTQNSVDGLIDNAEALTATLGAGVEDTGGDPWGAR